MNQFFLNLPADINRILFTLCLSQIISKVLLAQANRRHGNEQHLISMVKRIGTLPADIQNVWKE